ncbi:hypothetical protein SCP_0300180 [Sparassis crispa]|uniref:Uncharacterized protein n=1 Tax=Sparassis crispa TaxID=139825 RepID=A0A401GDW5_9APHY|nr:hypothetical protein SCP_0300180 [Sparassis crispa]GBE80303.1 hypothetical protein SCP_0300180 [Sparassis crispa]
MQMFGSMFVFGGRRAPPASLSLHRLPQCDDATPALHSHTLLAPWSPIFLRPPHSHGEPTRGQPGDTAWLRKVNDLALPSPFAPPSSSLLIHVRS